MSSERFPEAYNRRSKVSMINLIFPEELKPNDLLLQSFMISEDQSENPAIPKLAELWRLRSSRGPLRRSAGTSKDAGADLFCDSVGFE